MGLNISRRFLLTGAAGSAVATVASCASTSATLADEQGAFPAAKTAIDNPYLLGPPEGVALAGEDLGEHGAQRLALPGLEGLDGRQPRDPALERLRDLRGHAVKEGHQASVAVIAPDGRPDQRGGGLGVSVDGEVDAVAQFQPGMRLDAQNNWTTPVAPLGMDICHTASTSPDLALPPRCPLAWSFPEWSRRTMATPRFLRGMPVCR